MIAQREQALADFLQAAFPAHRIVRSAVPRRDHRDGAALPQVRVALSAIDGAALRWRLEFAEPDTARTPAGLYAAAETLRIAIAADPARRWRPCGGTLAPAADKVSWSWTEILEEAWTAAPPQALYAEYEEFLALPPQSVDTGAQAFWPYTAMLGAVDPADRFFIRDAAHAQYLGAVEADGSTLVTEHATTSPFEDALLYKLVGGIELPAAGGETDLRDRAAWQRLATSLTGRRAVHAIGAPRHRVSIACAAVPRADAQAILAWLDANSARPTLLLRRSDLTIESASVLRVERRTAADAMQLDLEFECATAVDLSEIGG